MFVPSALIASAGNNANEYLAKHVAELGYLRPTIVASGGEARRRMGDIDFEVVIINTPLPDEFGHELSTYAVEKSNAGVILLAKAGTADQISDKLQQHGVLVLAKPFTGLQFRQAVQMAAACCRRLDYLRQENDKLRDKIAQIRLVDRAKCYLIEHKGMSEAEAHRMIEKTAMIPAATVHRLPQRSWKKSKTAAEFRRFCGKNAAGAKPAAFFQPIFS